jgi:hypothetical protein
MTVQTINGVAKPSEITKRIGAQIQKRKTGKTPPENFDSILFDTLGVSFEPFFSKD